MIPREIAKYCKSMARKYPVITITGPRQSGKTTLSKATFPKMMYTNLEHPPTRGFAREDPESFLGQSKTGLIIDEIQRVPELLSYIQVIVDEKKENGLYILTGSQQFGLRSNISQSLAGRTAILRLLPFTHKEALNFGSRSLESWLHQGCYPRPYDQDIPPVQYYGDYLETYIERDLRQLSNIKDLSLFERFIRLCAGRTGCELNLNSLANDTGITQPTAREWISILEASFIIFLLPPYHANISKRLTKSPKLYFLDIGLATFLSGIEAPSQLVNHPMKGAFFETMVVTELVKHRYNQGLRSNLFYYREHSGLEIDILHQFADKLVPMEVKLSSTIKADFFKGIQSFKTRFPDQYKPGYIVYTGELRQQRSAGVALPYNQMIDELINLNAL